MFKQHWCDLKKNLGTVIKWLSLPVKLWFNFAFGSRLILYVHTLLLKRPIARKFLERSLPKSTQPTMLSQKTTWSDFLLIKLHKCTNLESWLTLPKRLRPQFEIFKQIILENSFCCVVTVFLWRLWTWQCPLNQFDRSINNSFHWVGNTLL